MVNIGDVVRVKPGITTSLSTMFDADTTFKVIALHFGPGHDPEGNADLMRPDGTVEPWFPASRLKKVTARQASRQS